MSVVRQYSNWLGSANPSDYYTFTVIEPTSIIFQSSGINQGPTIELLNAAGNAITSFNGSYTYNISAGTYFIEATSGADLSYSLSLTASAIPDHAGSTLATAHGLGGLTAGVQTISDFVGGADPTDYYSFTLSGTTTVNLLLSGVAQSESLLLLNSNGVQIGTSGSAIPDGKSGQNGSIVQTLAAGTYYVEIASGGTLTIPHESNYNLSFWTGTPAVGTAGSDGAGNTLGTAHSVGVLSSATFADWVGAADTDDYYQFSVTAVSSLNLQLSGVAQGSVALTLLDAAGNTITQRSAGATSLASIIDDLAAGTYYVDVSSSSNTGYNLSMSATAIADNAGNSTAAAQNIGALTATPQVHSDWIAPVDTDDYYKFTLSSVSTVSLQLFGLTAQANLKLLDSSGTQIIGTTGNPHNYGQINDTVGPGTYYIDVQYLGGENATNYQLSASATVIPDNAGNSLGAAHIVGNLSAAVQTFTDWVGGADTDDYYKFTLTSTSTVNILQSGPAGIDQPTSQITLMQSDGSPVQHQAGHLASDASLVYNLTAGDYYVDVSVISNDTPYTLSLWTGSPAVGTSASDGAGNSLGSAHAVGALDGSQHSFADWIGPADTDDYYQFTLSDTSSVNLLLSGVSASTTLLLEDTSGHNIASSSATSTLDGSLVYDLAAGTYYVDVQNLGGNTGYNLSMAAVTIHDTAGSSTSTARDIGNLNEAIQSDFNADGHSDILWRNDAGSLVTWDMNDGTVLSGNSLGAVPSNWTVAGTGDFNGDGNVDILWRNSSNDAAAIWDMNDGNILSANSLGTVPSNWTLAGTGDFNGDGKADILWRNSTNNAAVIWDMNDGNILSVNSLGTVPSNWTVAGTGDFNGDGKTDILWRNSTNDAAVIWDMNDGNILSANSLGTVPSNWTVAGTGDFNADGKTDILWRNSTNNAAVIWDMNDGNILNANSLGTVPANWTVAGIGDFNGDHKADILWRNDAGSVVIWDMNDGNITASHDLGAVPSNWHILI